MKNPYLPPTHTREFHPTGQRYLPPTRAEDYRPAGNQFTLRGLFIFMTATCVILGILALVMKEPSDWLGVVLVPLICAMIIVALEMGRLLFPPKPHFHFRLPPVSQNPLQTAYFGEGDSPFAGGKTYFGDDAGISPNSPQSTLPTANEQPPQGGSDEGA